MATNDCSQELTSFFSELKIVIFEPNSSIKMAIRTVLTDLGVPTKEIHVASKFSELDELLIRVTPNLVFAVDEVDALALGNLVRLHYRVRPLRLKAAFVVLSNYNSAVSASEVSEYGVDLLLAKPFTPVQLREKLIEFFSDRVNPSSDLVAMEEAKECIHTQDFSKALSLLEKIGKVQQRPAVHYYIGECFRFLGNPHEALNCYSKALASDPLHFMSLVRCYDLYFELKNYPEALSIARRLLKNYPINPRRIEGYIRLAVVTHSYADLIQYCDLAENLRSDPNVIRGLAAGLAVGARYILGQVGELRDLKLALLCLQHAARLGADFPKICQSVTRSYLDIGEYQLADTVLQKLILDGFKGDAATRELQMTLFYGQGEFSKALLVGLNLIKDKHYEETVFRMSIKAAVRIDRKPDFIRELYQDGLRRHPGLIDLGPLVDSL